jgi:hypothetical protein
MYSANSLPLEGKVAFLPIMAKMTDEVKILSKAFVGIERPH